MKLYETPLSGALRLELKRFSDTRGEFVKTYAASAFGEMGLALEMMEEFYSVSHKGVIRGMHFQLPPHDHAKFIYCAMGAVEDVLLDLRRGPDYGKACSFHLSAETPALIVIPKGVAHGFRSLTDQSLMVYKTSTEHAPASDSGIRWDSFGYDWGVADPIISERDHKHHAFEEFVTPFERV